MYFTNYLDKTFTTLLSNDDNYKEGCVDRENFEQEVSKIELTEEEKKDDYYVEEDIKGKKIKQKGLKTELTKEENKGDEFLKNSVCSFCTSILCCC